MAGEWTDVSVPIAGGMVHWPGDPEVKITRSAAIAAGDPANVTHLSLGAHTATHMDAPVHFLEGGAAIDAMPPEATIGPARVIEIDDPVAIRTSELRPHRPEPGERLLFKTRNSREAWGRAPEFAEDFVYIDAACASYLAQAGVRAVGVDYLSVGGYRHDSVETHTALLAAGVWIIEGLCLADVGAGPYQLVCLPIKIAGGDGAPARALLRRA